MNRIKEVLDRKGIKQTWLAKQLGKSYVEQFWNIPARTIIAYLYKVGIQFIHFDSNQERTLRVTAILQSFPCDFVFEVCRTSVFTQVGNNVLSLKAA